MRHPAALLIRLYQLAVSPLLGPRCRFHPSCSHYALQAMDRFGFVRGSWLAVKRIARCHPWNPGGYDPVPDAGAALTPQDVSAAAAAAAHASSQATAHVVRAPLGTSLHTPAARVVARACPQHAHD